MKIVNRHLESNDPKTHLNPGSSVTIFDQLLRRVAAGFDRPVGDHAAVAEGHHALAVFGDVVLVRDEDDGEAVLG